MQRQEVYKVAKTVWNLEVNGVKPHPRAKTWYVDTMKKNMAEAGLMDNDAADGTTWQGKINRENLET